MLKAIIESLGGIAKILFWFITAVVIPITIWFLVLKLEVNEAKTNISDLKVRIKEDEETVKSSFKTLDQKLDQIHKDLGQVMGELRRIK